MASKSRKGKRSKAKAAQPAAGALTVHAKGARVRVISGIWQGEEGASQGPANAEGMVVVKLDCKDVPQPIEAARLEVVA
jgi:hypothetical protein